MEMPKPTADHKKLEKLAGIWKGKETMHPSQWEPKGGTAEGVSRMRIALAGFNVITDYEQSRNGKKTFEGHGIYSFDPAQKQVVLHWFDSIGIGREEFRGTWTGDVLTLSSKAQQGHARLTYDFSKTGVMGARMETSTDGKTWAKMFDAQYQRAD